MLLLFRVSIAIMIMTHGWAKIQNFEAFSDPCNRSRICSGNFCDCRTAYQTIINTTVAFTMTVAVFVTHAADPFQVKELALIYLIVFITLFLLGPGRYSLDHLVFSRADIAN
ncbi:MAG: DoxX family protein [Rikenellaceae bacterium]